MARLTGSLLWRRFLDCPELGSGYGYGLENRDDEIKSYWEQLPLIFGW